MDIDALAIIVPSVTAVLLAGGNIWYQRWLTDRTLTQQTALTERTFDHEQAIAKDQRVQERISSAYVEMLTMLDSIMGIVNATQPILEPGPEPPPEPDQEKVGRVQALIAAFGSPEVKETSTGAGFRQGTTSSAPQRT